MERKCPPQRLLPVPKILSHTVEARPPRPVWTRAFVDLLIAEALFGFSYALFVLLPKLLAAGYGATAGQIGAVMASFGVASLVTIPLIAPIVKRLDNRRTMVLGTALLGVSALGFLLIHSAGLLAAVLRGAAGHRLVADVRGRHVAGRRGRAAHPSRPRHRPLRRRRARDQRARPGRRRADRHALRRAAAVPDLRRGRPGRRLVLPPPAHRRGRASAPTLAAKRGSGRGAQPRDRDRRARGRQPGGRGRVDVRGAVRADARDRAPCADSS